MDLQDILCNVIGYIKLRRIGTARRQLRFAYSVDEDEIAVSSLIKSAVSDLNHGKFRSAVNDVQTVKIIDAREMQFAC